MTIYNGEKELQQQKQQEYIYIYIYITKIILFSDLSEDDMDIQKYQ